MCKQAGPLDGGKQNQRLDINQTGKWKKSGWKGIKNLAKFHAIISYGKYVAFCKPFIGAMNSERYCKLIFPKVVQGIEATYNTTSERVF